MPEQIENRLSAAGATRRRFLAVAGWGIAGAAVVAGMLPFGRRSVPVEGSSEFPGPGSIFHPARDPRSDPRR